MCYSYVYHHLCHYCSEILEITTLRKQECYRASCNGEITSPPRILKRLVLNDGHLRWCVGAPKINRADEDDFPLVIAAEVDKKRQTSESADKSGDRKEEEKR